MSILNDLRAFERLYSAPRCAFILLDRRSPREMGFMVEKSEALARMLYGHGDDGDFVAARMQDMRGNDYAMILPHHCVEEVRRRFPPIYPGAIGGVPLYYVASLLDAPWEKIAATGQFTAPPA